MPEFAGATPATLRFGHPRELRPVQYVPGVLAALLIDRLASALRHVFDMTPDLLFSAAEFAEALLNLLDGGAASAASNVSPYCSMRLRFTENS